jgi:hypothetical protein
MRANDVSAFSVHPIAPGEHIACDLPADKPNIVSIVLGAFGYGDADVYGGVWDTACLCSIDRLSAEGMGGSRV